MPRFALPKDGSPISWEMEDVVGEPNKWIIKTEQDEAPILEHNLALRNSGYTGNLTFGRQIASIPIILWNRWIKKYPCLKNGPRDPDYQPTLYRLIMQNPKVKVNDEHLGKIR